MTFLLICKDCKVGCLSSSKKFSSWQAKHVNHLREIVPEDKVPKKIFKHYIKKFIEEPKELLQTIKDLQTRFRLR